MPSCYQLERSICAVMLKPASIATRLKRGTVVKVVGPSHKLPGLVDIECDGTHYAVFAVDLDDYGVKIEETAVRASSVP